MSGIILYAIFHLIITKLYDLVLYCSHFTEKKLAYFELSSLERFSALYYNYDYLFLHIST